MNYKLLSGVFLEGILSFLSPCVLPLIPLYMSYLSGENKETDENGNVTYKTGKVFITTLFFVLGICLTFVLIAISVNIFNDFFSRYVEVISIIGGTLLIIFGLNNIGVIHIDVLNKEFKINMNLKMEKMNFMKAFLLGFVFSLGWSPCIGPMLANAIFLASTEANGYLYIIAYGLGMIIPFLITGLFTSYILNLINKHKNIVKWTMIVSGVILICYGSYMIYNAAEKINVAKTVINIEDDESKSGEDIQNTLYNYVLKNYDGKEVKLSDYKGKYIFLNFTTSWCQYCDIELPEYTKFAENEEVKCFYIMTPLNETGGMNDIDKHMEEKGVEVETLIDEDGIFFYYCGISAYPTIYVVSPEGEFIVYAQGAMDISGFESMLEYAKQETSD